MKMNKLASVLLGGSILFGAASCGEMADELSGIWQQVELPEAVETQFASLYPDVKNPEWDEEADGFEAEFEMGGRERSVLFSKAGQLLQVEEEMEANNLPPQVLDYVQEHFSRYDLAESTFLKKGEQTFYVVELENRNEEAELIFNQSGELVQQKGDAGSGAATVQQASLAGPLVLGNAKVNAFARPEASWVLPAELREVSGIALLDDERMACVQDEKGSIFIYNLKDQELEKEYPFGAAGDYEGLAVDGSTAYVLRSDGTVFQVKEFESSKPQVKKYKSALAASQNTEGLALDKADNRLLIACKGHDKTLGKNKGIYELSLESGKMRPEPVITIPLEQELLQATTDKKKKDLYDVLQPSSLEIHPLTGEHYLLDAVNGRIMLVSEDGKLSSVTTLDKKMLRQAEGLSFGSNGEVYIASEGSKKGRGVIHKYKSGL
ncbi:SdiA-regulated domain-containing protein [Pontibacter mangrovi]|nr:PepSY-like domain-containing protein [Pontibacter mangrovi]